MNGKERLHREQSSRKGRTVSRRSFLRLSTVLPVSAAVAAVGGTALAIDRYRHNQAIEDKLAEFRTKEANLDKSLVRFEEGYFRFAEKAKTVIKTRITDPQTREDLQVPFEVFEINRSNPLKNGYKVAKEELEKSRSLEGFSEVRLANVNFFLYAMRDEYNGNFASYNPRSRVLGLPATYAPENLLDNSVITHELIHVARDTQDRNTLPRDVYVSFYSTPSPSGRPKTVDIYEAEAYIGEIEIVNLMTDGRFRELILSKEKNLVVYRELFGSRAEQDGASKS